MVIGDWLQQNPIPAVLIGLALSAILGGFFLFIGNLWYGHHVRPVLSWGSIRVRGAHFNQTLQAIKMQLPPIQRQPVAFYASMVAVHNKGKSAAENCSGHLEVEGNREHICWFIPSSRRTMMINRDDFEFLEVCGWQEPDNSTVQTRKRIAPTEEGWQVSGANRDIDLRCPNLIKATIVVTAANARSIRLPILIESINNLDDPRNEPLFRPM